MPAKALARQGRGATTKLKRLCACAEFSQCLTTTLSAAMQSDAGDDARDSRAEEPCALVPARAMAVRVSFRNCLHLKLARTVSLILKVGPSAKSTRSAGYYTHFESHFVCLSST